MADVDELARRARRAESDGELREALRLYRAALESVPDQEIAVRAARVLDRAGRTDEALDVLRRTWERRTGRRLPAGEIERAARRLDAEADLASWTPEWPPAGEDDEPPERVAPAVAVGDPDADVPAGESRDGGRRPGGREAPRADGAESGPPRDEVDDGEDAAPSRRFVRRYDRQSGGDGGGARRRLGPRDEAPADPGQHGEVRGTGRDAGSGESPEPPGANGEGDLRGGLEVLEELLTLAPRDRRLRRRKVRYARRLGEPDLLEEALVELGDLLEEEGARRGARLLYEEAGAPQGAPGPRRGAADEDVDEAFRRRLSAALEDAPRELERLQAAGMEAFGAEAEGAGAVPWRAHRELGRFLLLRGRPDEAARHLAAARDRAPDGGGEDAADVLYELGLAHRRAGRPREARDCFRRLADRDTGFAVAWEALST